METKERKSPTVEEFEYIRGLLAKAPKKVANDLKPNDRIMDSMRRGFVVGSISPKRRNIRVYPIDPATLQIAVTKPQRLNTKPYRSSGIGSGYSGLVYPKFTIITKELWAVLEAMITEPPAQTLGLCR